MRICKNKHPTTNLKSKISNYPGHIVFPSLVYGSPRIAMLLGALWCLMNSDEFKLIFGSDTESEEDYIFTGFSEQDLLMRDTNSSNKKHSKTKRTPTATPSVQENVEATPQDEHCVRPCEN